MSRLLTSNTKISGSLEDDSAPHLNNSLGSKNTGRIAEEALPPMDDPKSTKFDNLYETGKYDRTNTNPSIRDSIRWSRSGHRTCIRSAPIGV